MISRLFVSFYRLWHGKLRLKGAGRILSRLAPFLPDLQSYPLTVPELGVVKVDFRDSSAFAWFNTILDEKTDEDGLLNAIERILSPGLVFWDIGANVGTISARFALPKYQLQSIHAFEPNPIPYRVALSLFNNSQLVTLHNIGIYSIDVTLQLNSPSKESMLSSMKFTHTDRNSETIDVPCFSVDTLINKQDLPPPNVIKIDVEGMELEVLKGMSNCIQQTNPAIFIEHLFVSEDVLKSLLPTGYVIKTVSRIDGSLSNGFDRSWGHNSVLLPENRTANKVSQNC